MNCNVSNGVGLGLRWEFLDEVLNCQLDALAKISFFEISPENYMRRGGHFPAALERVAALWPISTHGLMMSLGSTEPFDPEYFDELRRFLGKFGGAWHSDHLSFSSSDGVSLHDLLPVPFNHATARRIAARIREAAERLERPMLVENISYYTTLGRSELAEPEFISDVLESANAGLLLDINNLDVNAKNHGFDPWSWLSRIPLDRVVEIHVAGPEPYGDGLLLDTHGSPVRDSVYELLAWVLERTGPMPVLLERDNNVPSLEALLVEIRMLASTYDAAVNRWAMRQGGRNAA